MQAHTTRWGWSGGVMSWAGMALVSSLLLFAVPGCRGTPPGSVPSYLGDGREGSRVDTRHLDPALAQKWQALQHAWGVDPTDREIVALADAVLETDPPPEVRLEALLTKAAHHALLGADTEAVAVCAEGLASGQAGDSSPVVRELRRVCIRALVRGGDPAAAVGATDPASLAELFEAAEQLALRAIALDRAGQGEAAAPALAAWRAAVPDDSAEALYAESRLRAVGASLSAAVLAGAAEASAHPLAKQCLALMARETGDAVSPSRATPHWVRECAAAPPKIGVLLPRTGPLSALADAQLSAAVVATSTLGITEGLAWRDAGATPAQAAAAARALVADGVDSIVGPVGPAAIRAVLAAVGTQVRVVLPGEPSGDAVGVAPTLEQRLAALVEHARAAGVTQFLVAAPDNGYGRRAVKGIKAALEKKERKSLIIQHYPTGTTSFSPVLAPLFPALRKHSALVVPDHLSRVEMLVRQLTRSGHGAAQRASEGPLVLSTAEGADADSVLASAKVLEHLRVAPVAVLGATAEDFATAYKAAQGHAPDDQALLVFYALQAARSAGSTIPVPAVRIVSEGALVPPAP